MMTYNNRVNVVEARISLIGALQGDCEQFQWVVDLEPIGLKTQKTRTTSV